MKPFSYTLTPLQSVLYYESKLRELGKHKSDCDGQCNPCDRGKGEIRNSLGAALLEAKNKAS